ncbi:hypothetical protein MKW92_030924, partial [Papaver armeniacum]
MCNIMEHGAKVSCHSRPNCIKDYARELDGIYLKLLEESCFGHLIHLPSLSFCSNVVHNVLLRRKDTPKKDKEEEEEDAMSFIIGNQVICFGEREFAMMSGLKFQGSEEIDQNPKRIPLMEAHFPGQDNVKFGDLVEKFYQLQNSEDKLKLGLLSIAEGVIMGHGLYKNVNKGHFLLVDNLEEFNSYPWGKLSYKATISSLIRASKLKHVSNGKHTLNKMVYNLYGFPHVFQAWIFHSIPSLKENYTVENKDCSQTLYPRILHLEVPRIHVTLHKKIWKELSRLDIKVLSPLHPTQEELKECYMAGLLSEGEDSGVRGHESDSGIKELNGEAEANAQWEANHNFSPTNSSSLIGCTNSTTTSNNCSRKRKKKQIINLKSNSQLLKKVDKKIGTNTKEYITLSNDEDEDVESLENLKLKLGSEIEILKKERSAVESDTHHYKFLEEKAILIKEKLELRRDIESLNKEKTKLSTDTDLLNKEKEKLECDFGILNKQHQKLQFDFEILNKEKTKLGNDVELLSSCHSRPNCIKDYARELDGIYLKLMEESCFGHLIHLPSLSFCSNVVHNVLLRRKDTPKKDKEEEEEDAMSFIIGNQVICFGEREFAMMSGLKFQGSEEIDQNPKRIPLMEAHFPGQDNVKLGDLVEKFYQLQNSEDKLKLGLLSIAEGVIMGHGLYKNVNKGHFLLVDNLEEFNSYPWGKLSYKATISSLIRASKLKHVSNGKHTLNKMVYNLYGFPHVFQAWIFHSIPSLKENYTVENKDCSQTLYPRILHLEVPRIHVTLHKKIWKELSRLDIKVLSPLHPRQEELKECYMAGLLSEDEDSGVRGHESDSGIKVLNGEAEANAQREANHNFSPTNSSKVDNKIGTNTKEYITLSNDEDEDVESLENLKLKLGSEIEILKKERSAVESDVGLLNKKREEMETHHYKFLEEKAILIKEKLELRRDIESLNKEKTKLSTDTDLLNKEKEKLECDFGILNKQHQKLQFDFEILNKEKTKLGNDVELLSRYKSETETGYEFLKDEKNKLATDLEFTNKEKDKLRNDVELLNEEKGKLLSDVEFLNEEKAKLGVHTELLSKEKTKLQSDFECLNRKSLQYKVIFVRSMKRRLHCKMIFVRSRERKLQYRKIFVRLMKRRLQYMVIFARSMKTRLLWKVKLNRLAMRSLTWKMRLICLARRRRNCRVTRIDCKLRLNYLAMRRLNWGRKLTCSARTKRNWNVILRFFTKRVLR